MTDTIHCGWAPADDRLYRAYHDTEWGVPERDPRALWEKLQLDGMQAGLSWITILRKRENLRQEFDGFEPESLARWDEQRIARAMLNPGIIRSSAKISAIVSNARIYLDMRESGIDFTDWCWSFTGGKTIVNTWRNYRDAPTSTDWSERMAKEFRKRGFKFAGPTILYAFGQAVGMVNDHEINCPRHRAVQEAT
jgi:DNA-3-methyladenine glycosylase I